MINSRIKWLSLNIWLSYQLAIQVGGPVVEWQPNTITRRDRGCFGWFTGEVDNHISWAKSLCKYFTPFIFIHWKFLSIGKVTKIYHDLNISSVINDLIITIAVCFIVASIFLIEDYCDSPCFLYNIYFSQNNFLCVLSKYAMLDFFFNSRGAFCRIQWYCEVSRVIELFMNNKTCFH